MSVTEKNTGVATAASELENIVNNIDNGSERVRTIYNSLSSIIAKLKGSMPAEVTANDCPDSDNLVGKLNQSTDRLHYNIANLEDELKRLDGVV